MIKKKVSKTILLAIFSSLLLGACTKTATPEVMEDKAPAVGEVVTEDGAMEELAFTIENFAFTPNIMTVSPGQVITVTNKDSVAHTLTSNDGSFSTGLLAQDQTETFTAPTIPGTYAFHCTPHPSMTGNLIVR